MRISAAPPRPAAVVASLVSLGFGAGLATLLLRAPLQVTDSLLVMLDAQASPSLPALLVSKVSEQGYFRPFHWAQVKLLLDLGGDPAVLFRTFHAVLTMVAFWLFGRALRVRTATDVAALLPACAVFMGTHTFRGTVWESFPINHYLEIVIATLAAVNLSLARPRFLTDVAAVALTAVAVLTLESGVLVWVCVVTGFAVGLQGVSWRGVAGSTMVLAAYFGVRFFVLDVGMPMLGERATGFGFERLDSNELIARFGEGRAWKLYVYNIGSSWLTVLFAEPRSGQFVVTQSLLTGSIAPWAVMGALSSILTTVLIAAYSVRRARAVHAGRAPATDDDRVLVVFAMVLAANSVLAYSYTKDVILSPAGALYAIAAFIAIKTLLSELPVPQVSYFRTAAVATLLLAVVAIWSMRGAALLWSVRHMAYQQRYEWAFVDVWLARQSVVPEDPETIALINGLRVRAISARVPVPKFSQPWAQRYVDQSR